jgi:hypothetical protein
MIARLRQRHRRAWLTLAVLLSAIIIIAWRARQPPAVMDRLPGELSETTRR